MLRQKTLETIEKYELIKSGDRIVLGVSGGPDSISMLSILNDIKNKGLIDFSFVVAHINHGIRENSKKEEEYVLEFCKKINIDCFVLHAKVKELAKTNKKGIEETGRDVRYEFFKCIMKKTGSNKIAIAHNSNDNIETIIMNIIRGSGTNGLKGIEGKNGVYIRPFIEIKREEIEKYCKDNKLNPRHDESNDENIYTRNKIRNIVIPYIQKEFNTKILDTIERLSSIAKEELNYLDMKTEEAYNKICIEEINISKNDVYNMNNKSTIILDLKMFNMEEKIIQKRIILYSINKLFGSKKGIEKIHIEDIIKLCNNNIGNKFLTPNKKTKIAIKNKKIYVMSIK